MFIIYFLFDLVTYIFNSRCPLLGTSQRAQQIVGSLKKRDNNRVESGDTEGER